MRLHKGGAAALAVLAASALLAGCADLGYYWQSASGHLGLMRAARPVPEWLDDPATSEALRPSWR
jgi:predicted aminopeptidase